MGWMGEGTLARTSILGSAPRVMVEHVREADWDPAGSDLAVVRRMGGFERLEYPIGKVLYQTSGFISHIRFSPAGNRIALPDHPVYADDAGAVAMVDLEGHRTTLSEGWISVHGLVWTRDGSEIWFGGTKGSAVSGDGIYGVTPTGRVRAVIVGPGRYKIMDIASDGRVLISNEREERTVEALMAESPAPVQVGLRSSSSGWWIADDGTSILIADQSTASYETLLLKAGATTPVHLGSGNGISVSPDSRWALGLPVTGYPSWSIRLDLANRGRCPIPKTLSTTWSPGRTLPMSSGSVRRVVSFLAGTAGHQRGFAATIYASRHQRGEVVANAGRPRRNASSPLTNTGCR